MTTVPPVTIPAPLVEAVRSSRVILFLGSGASMEAKSENGMQPPSAKQLAADLGKHFLGQDLSDFGLMQVAEMASRARGQNVVFEHIRSQLKTFKPSPAHMLIPKFRWHTIATTNYDTLVESAYGATNNPIQNLIPFVKDSEPLETKISEFQNSLVYLKLHGCVEHAHDADIPLILDPSHYERYRTNRERLFDRLSDYAHEIPFLFIGYAFSDPHIQNLIYRLNRTGSRPEYYVVGPKIPPAIAQHWLSERIVAINATFSGFMTAVPSIYSIVPPNDGSALRHGHHFEPVDFVIDHGRGHHDAYSAGSCQRTYARACGCRQRPRRHREELIESERGWSGREAFVTMMQTADLGQGNDRSGPGRLNGSSIRCVLAERQVGP